MGKVRKMSNKNIVVITAIGLNQPGIIAKITTLVAELNGNIEDISQTIMQNLFTCIMTIDITTCQCDFNVFKDSFENLGEELGSKIVVQHQDTFHFMHRV